MAKQEVLTLSVIAGLFSYDGLYVICYAWLFGMSLWISFFGGVIAYKTLPRQMFGSLQHKTFPIYFSLSIALSSALLSMWTFSHPDVLTHISRPELADVAQAYALASVLLTQGMNLFIVGPLTSRVMFQRYQQEKDERKTDNDAGVSQEMKKLNAKFGVLHGISSLANLGAVAALAFHGLWIGNVGHQGY